MNKKTMKALNNLNAYVDYEYQKLCDELSDTKVSHKRLEKLLKETQVLLKTFWHLVSSDEKMIIFYDAYCNHQFLRSAENLTKRIDLELSYPYLRCNWHKKGGQNVERKGS